MVSVPVRREQVAYATGRGLSRRRACTLTEVGRSALHYRSRKAERHRAREFIAFLRRIDRCVQRQLDVHVALDNSSTQKTPEVKAWLEKHARFKLHLTPTSAS